MIKLQKLYAEINLELFEESLPILPCIENGRLTKTFGRCHMRYSKITKKWTPEKIDIQSGLEGEQLRKTLVHEMCHVWAVSHYQETGHGQYFWQKMKECGYPDGHRLDEGKNDAWVQAKDFGFCIGQDIRWTHRKKKYQGIIQAIHRRTVTAIDNERSLRWRIPPNQVDLVAVQLRGTKQLKQQKNLEYLREEPSFSLGDVVFWKQDGEEYTGVVIWLKKGCCLVECEADETTWKIPYAMLHL